MPTISSTKFWYVVLLIILIPIGVHWKALLYGQYIKGTVIGYKMNDYPFLLNAPIEDTDIFTIVKISFPSDTTLATAKNIVYPLSAQVPLIYYNRSYLFLSFSGFYFNPYGAFSFGILLFWIAFYLATQKKTN